MSGNRLGGIVFGEIVLGFVVQIIVGGVGEEIVGQDVLLGVARGADRLGAIDKSEGTRSHRAAFALASRLSFCVNFPPPTTQIHIACSDV